MNVLKKLIVKYLIKNKDTKAKVAFSKDRYVYEKKSFNVFLYPKDTAVYYSIISCNYDGCDVDEYDRNSNNINQIPRTRKISWNDLDNYEYMAIVKIYKGAISENGLLSSGQIERYHSFSDYIFGEWFFMTFLWTNGIKKFLNWIATKVYNNPRKNAEDIYSLRIKLLNELHRGQTEFSKGEILGLLYPKVKKHPTPVSYRKHLIISTFLADSLVETGELDKTHDGKYIIKKLPATLADHSLKISEIKSTKRLSCAVAWLTVLGVIVAIFGAVATAGAFNSVGKYYDSKIANYFNISVSTGKKD